MMKINGIEAKPKDGQLRSIITYPAPKARLVNEWGDAPTQVDTSVALTPHAQSISEVMGIKADDEHTLKSSMILRDSNNVEVYGRVFSIRTSAFQFVPFSDRLTELALNGVIDEPSITQGTEVVEVTSLFTPLDGTQDHNRMTAIKAGAVENIDGLIGNYYVSDDKVVLDRVAFSVRGLIIAPIEEDRKSVV